MSGFSNAILGGMQKLIRAAIQSPNFVTGVSGWAVRKDGSSEFNNVIARGSLIVGSNGGWFLYTGMPGFGNPPFAWSTNQASDPFGNVLSTGTLGGVASQLGNALGMLQAGQLVIGNVTFTNQGLVSANGIGGPDNKPVLSIESPMTSNTDVQGIIDLFSRSAGGIPILSTNGHLQLESSVTVILPSGDSTGVQDLATIQNALNNGLSVFLAPGIFYVNAPVSLPSYGILRGSGRPALGKTGATVIQATATMAAVIASANYLTNTAGGNTGGMISDLQVDANNFASNCIALMTFDAVIRHCGIENPLFNGIIFTALTRNGTVGLTGDTPNNRVESCSIHKYGQYGIYANDGANTVFTDGFITDCIIATGSGGGSGARGISLDHSAGWKIEGNHLYGLAGHGIMAGVPFNTRIANNYFEAWGQSATASTYYAIDGVTKPVNGGHGLIVEGNIFYCSAAPGNALSNIIGIGLITPTGATNYFLVAGNEVFFGPASGFASAVGIQWSNGGATSVTNGVSTGNQVHGTWTTPVQQNAAGGTITLTSGV